MLCFTISHPPVHTCVRFVQLRYHFQTSEYISEVREEMLEMRRAVKLEVWLQFVRICTVLLAWTCVYARCVFWMSQGSRSFAYTCGKVFLALCNPGTQNNPNCFQRCYIERRSKTSGHERSQNEKEDGNAWGNIFAKNLGSEGLAASIPGHLSIKPRPVHSIASGADREGVGERWWRGRVDFAGLCATIKPNSAFRIGRHSRFLF